MTENAPLPTDDRLALWAHLVSAHAAVCGFDASLEELSELHDHEHSGPGTIRNHPREDRSADRAKIAVCLNEVVESEAPLWSAPDATWMCELCFPSGFEVGYVAPGLSLIFFEGAYQLLWGQGHSGDVIWKFACAPSPDPITPEIELWLDSPTADPTEVSELLELSAEWLTVAEADSPRLTLENSTLGAWFLVGALMVAGYSPQNSGTVELWLFNRAGELIAAHNESLTRH